MASSVDDAFTALADPTRRRVVRLLAKKPRRSSDLADALELSRPATSKHLRVLRRAGIVHERISEADARERIYDVDPKRLAPVRTWVEQVEAFWNEQLTAFAEHVSRRRRGR